LMPKKKHRNHYPLHYKTAFAFSYFSYPHPHRWELLPSYSN